MILVVQGPPSKLVTSHIRILRSGDTATLRMALGSAEIELGEIKNYPRFARRITRKLSEINGLSREYGFKHKGLAKGKLRTPKALGRLIFDELAASFALRHKPRWWDEIFEHGTDNLTLTVDRHTANIPWELAHDGQSFMFENLQVTRRIHLQRYAWTAGVGTPAEQDMKDVVVVGLNYEKTEDELDFAETEASAVSERLRKLGYNIVGGGALMGSSATHENVVKALKNRGQPLFAFHFTGHGSGKSLALVDRNLTISQIRECFGKGGAPFLTFLNACSTGQIDRSGFVEAIAAMGGNEIIASFWSIYEDAATVFADTFYDRIDKGFHIAQAMSESREKLRRRGSHELTWPAFVAYGPELQLAKLQETRT